MPDQADLRTRTARQRLADLEQRVAVLEQQKAFIDMLMDVVEARGFQRGRESVLGKGADPRPRLRPRHLRTVK